MTGKRIVVGVTGGIAVFKVAGLVSQLAQRGADVRVIMTRSASKFVTPLTFQTLSRNPVAVDTFEEKDPSVVTHIDLADHADLFVIAPATANILAKMAHGLGDDMLSTTLLATRAPILIAPAMNVHMYQNPVVQENIRKLEQLGHRFVEPASGQLACGYVGQGRMEEPERILEVIEEMLREPRSVLQGKRVLVTAGPTREPLDPVRYLSNRSSGKMGYAIAEACVRAGAETVLVSGPTALTPPSGVRRVQVTTAEEMWQAVMQEMTACDVIIKAAAVADYTPVTVASQKMKKTGDRMRLELRRTRDILAEAGQRKEGRFLVGFAAETEQVAKHAMDKLHRKKLDLVVANDVSRPGAGFDGDTNKVTVFDAEGEVVSLPQMSKREVADRLVALIGERLHHG
ncbi:bifunctional phosphopantothenoylcysteine decarboxylase/phosphopantothenate--cysteine ligase CoaBC [Kroppenstedtia eburnea]|uniref:Coenzyme A biosynthesis bifunctional protein CoaBC n=1 Tax=Kroppenstedtia eburnea TaxID=714067 RepID=A0A1N7J2C1_9BACL|nr:bifunctional phosphopantothenoylcysteine decarboxylase/phosphopantothenate--cysteine ligase CoaBC [Kroppenstedtia eburnea]EGK13272.1 coenzyme A biosynthesis bifunctional protein CoaBC [Desmospora sp. 8437]QKI82444.1 bifunctional phosphopantothenoylcysteine decarboxylase/phosphopantothenate--cysteine ligase CoaBC [Kroppenstedtia eburnea]SIS43490.1 phosphopantothenoylcysteine decarboxylase / phosphopantothenate--cysteine ligase [Kroppenstedtia eburnea]